MPGAQCNQTPKPKYHDHLLATAAGHCRNRAVATFPLPMPTLCHDISQPNTSLLFRNSYGLGMGCNHTLLCCLKRRATWGGALKCSRRDGCCRRNRAPDTLRGLFTSLASGSPAHPVPSHKPAFNKPARTGTDLATSDSSEPRYMLTTGGGGPGPGGAVSPPFIRNSS